MAAAFALPFGLAELGRIAGLWHDAGKFHPEFQRYLRDCAEDDLRRLAGEHVARRSSYVPHSPAGTLACWPSTVACLIAGHHGGLRALHEMESIVEEWRRKDSSRIGLDAAIAQLGPAPPACDEDRGLKDMRRRDSLACEFLTRMAFSALVDADRLDTEAHGSPGKALLRVERQVDAAMHECFTNHIERLRSKIAEAGKAGAVNDARVEMLKQCLDAAAGEPGVYRLSMPTGGGKTLASLGFALKHCLTHDLRRIVMAIPYTSITEQTSGVYRKVFAPLGGGIVLEHHSALGEDEQWSGPVEDIGGEEASWREVACENWDAPLVVTTTVQLFNSLHSNSTTATRKLHNLARSVIIIDEAQTLPGRMQEPCVRMLEALVKHCYASVVLCTATQPALNQHSDWFKGFDKAVMRGEIVSEPARYFDLLRRVRYEILLNEPWDWDRLAEELLAQPQCLCILNTRKDALAVLDALEACAGEELGLDYDADSVRDWLRERGVFHLSTLLTGAHRKLVLAEVRDRLLIGQPCLLVSTQVVEAGVDLDFPRVMRALGPLDRIIQAAGRCNREGRRGMGAQAGGLVTVFVPAEGSAPRGEYKSATELTRDLLSEWDDLDSLELQERYFSILPSRTSHSDPELITARRKLDYPETARLGRLIKEETVAVVVDYGHVPPGSPLADCAAQAAALLADMRLRLQRGEKLRRDDYRALQQHCVSLTKWKSQEHQGLIRPEALGAMACWEGGYEEIRGIQFNGMAVEDLVY